MDSLAAITATQMFPVLMFSMKFHERKENSNEEFPIQCIEWAASAQVNWGKNLVYNKPAGILKSLKVLQVESIYINTYYYMSRSSVAKCKLFN